MMIAKCRLQIIGSAAAALLAVAALHAADLKVDLSKETVGKPPATFEPMVGTWLVAQDGADKVIMIDGRPWVASKDNPTKLRGEDIAWMIKAALEMNDRGFTPELTVFATNPKD